MTATLPKVAVIGRQNVGKSTLVNRLFGRRETIAHEMPGVTRDRVEVQTTWRDRTFALIDTGGYTRVARGIESLVASQADRAAAEADLILLVVDAQAGVTEEDAILARRLRRSTVPVLLVANKADGEREEADVAALYALGLGEPLPVSALHGRGAGDLLDRVVQLLPEETPVERSEEARPEPRFALVGRPNVGKSSIFNALVGEERSVVYQEAGTTRDSVDALLEWADGPVRFVDTAGMRRQTRVTGVEYYGFVRATRAIERADVAVAVIEAPEGFTSEDKKIVVRVLDAGRGLLIAANKWDLVEDKDRTFKRLSEQAALFANATIMRTSATRGQGVHRLPPLLMDLHVRWAHRVSTAKVNEVLQIAQMERPTPRNAGNLHYATQVGSGPPTFVIFGGSREPDPSYQRYLENRLRRTFGYDGVPIRLTFRPRTRGSKPAGKRH
ncbi:MAG: ribosome biogenesis GTPase Der [Actinomycetota bacterium]